MVRHPRLRVRARSLSHTRTRLRTLLHTHSHAQMCAVEDDEENMVLCDECDGGYHIYCVSASLICVPLLS